MKTKSQIALLTCVVALSVTAVGCAKNADDTAATQTETAGGGVNTVVLRVTDLNLGSHLGADKRVTNATDDFTTRDTIYASVETEGTASSAPIVARLTFQDGQVVDEQTQIVSPTGNAVTEFHFVKPSAWPKGKYKVTILLNGVQAEEQEIEVK